MEIVLSFYDHQTGPRELRHYPLDSISDTAISIPNFLAFYDFKEGFFVHIFQDLIYYNRIFSFPTIDQSLENKQFLLTGIFPFTDLYTRPFYIQRFQEIDALFNKWINNFDTQSQLIEEIQDGDNILTESGETTLGEFLEESGIELKEFLKNNFENNPFEESTIEITSNQPVELILSYYDPILGPREILSVPGLRTKNKSVLVSQYFDFHHSGDFFINLHEQQVTFNQIFSIDRLNSLGNQKQFMPHRSHSYIVNNSKTSHGFLL